MDMYIDKRPIDEIINSTDIIPQYEFIVNDIIRDRDYGWTLDYFKGDGTTTYDTIIYKTKKEISECMKEIVENKLLIDKSRDSIEKNKKLKQIDIDNLNKKIEIAIDNINELNNMIKKEEKILKDYEWLQFVEISQERSLRMIRNKFQMNGNLEYVRRGVSWACSYAEKLRGNTIAGLPKPPYIQKVDNSAW